MSETGVCFQYALLDNLFIDFQFWVSLLSATLLTVASLLVTPPTHLPDLFPVLVSVFSCAHFLVFLICFHYLQFTCNDLDLGESEVMSENIYLKSGSRSVRRTTTTTTTSRVTAARSGVRERKVMKEK